MLHPTSPLAALRSFLQHLPLITQLVRRDVAARYRGSVLGIVWTLATPLLALAVYTFVFSVVFKARWGIDTGDGGRGEFAILLFSGILLHGLLAECLSRAPTVIVDHNSFVKKVVFPLEIFHLRCWAVRWCNFSLAF